ncbi:hypothetical protein ACQQ2N_06075 [Dokdonella sp. MW10]|uniref:hypothetical protein n=1 Tax=Dokdonella sp. MW10 TaxID=2992926 RepID=UPI003F80D486
MTIREHLMTRLNGARAVAFVAGSVIAVATFVTDHMQDRTIRLTLFAFFGAPVLYILFFIRCPRCKASVGQALGGRHPPDACPACGVRFDKRL